MRSRPTPPASCCARSVLAARACRGGRRRRSLRAPATRTSRPRLTIAPDLPAMVSGDALRLRAALENLVDNAVKFTERGARSRSPPLPSRPRAAALRLIFTLTDSGIGMSPAEMKRLFRPFAQASEQIARRYGGAGLGPEFRQAHRQGDGRRSRPSPASQARARHSASPRWSTPADARRAGEAARRAGAPTRALSLLCAEDNPYGRVVMNTILDRTRPPCRLRRKRRGGGRCGGARRLRRGADGRDAVRASTAWKRRAASARCRAKRAQVPVIGISGRGDAATKPPRARRG